MAKKKKSNFVKKHKDGKEEVNPFELKINKKRHNVLGQKLRNDKGKPGMSRSRAMKRRAETFRKSLTLTKKSNAFIDRRIGECNDDLSKEDMIVERMTIARKKKYKKDVYNLNDEEALTHYGQPLSEIEKFDFPDEDSDDDNEDAQLGSDYVDKAHFGGFLTKKLDGSEDDQKTHKEIIGELILDSKKRKDEKKAEKVINDNLTEKLDQEWKNVHSLLRAVKDDCENKSVGQLDPYDMVVKELRFEPRGKPADPLKSEEELKKTELMKMKKLEEERMKRMREEDNKQKIEDNLSPDSIYDGLDLEDEIRTEMTLQQKNDDYSDDDDADEHLKSTMASGEESNGFVENDAEIDFSSDGEDFEDSKVETSQDTNDVDIKVEVPQTLDQLTRLLSDKSKEEASNLIGSMITSNCRNLDDKTKQRLDLFFCLLLKYVNKISRTKDLGFLDVAALHLYSLTQIARLKTGLIFKKYLVKKLSDYEKTKTSGVDFPSLDILVALKFSAILFPTSDYRHEIVTPCMLMMSDILTSHYKITLRNILSRLFVCCLFYEYVLFSKRLAAEPIVFLETVLHMASVGSSNRCPNKKFSKGKKIFFVDSKLETEPSSINMHLLTKESKLKKSSDLTVSILFCAVTQLHKFAELYCQLPSFAELFSQTKVLCEHLPVHLYPNKLSTSVSNLKEFLYSRETVKQYLTFPKKKPKMLKMFEPRFEMNDSDKKMTLQKQISLEKKLSQKIKREEKSILREMRRDAQFVAHKQIQEKMEADAERKRKVKQLYQELSIQQGECKKFAKRK